MNLTINHLLTIHKYTGIIGKHIIYNDMKSLLRHISLFILICIILVPSTALSREKVIKLHAPSICSVSTEKCLIEAKKGDVAAQYYIGLLYDNGYGGVLQDHKEALKWYHKAAEQGFDIAQFRIGFIYDNGHGVPQDHKEALKWYHKAAEQGFINAQFKIGLLYYNGLGISKDHKKALKWFRKAAEQEHIDAQYNIGFMYYNGIGAPQDYKKALKWYLKAAEQGHVDAQYNIGLMYANGYGIHQDFKKAYAWSNIAAAKNNKLSPLRDKVSKQLSSQELVQAQKLSKKYWQLYSQPFNKTKE